jgi:hypothetical protein
MRVVAATVVLLAGCGGGSPDAPEEPPPHQQRLARGGDLRSADARSPLVAARGGAYHCPTEGRIVLAISADGEASLTIGGRLLASVASTRAVVNRVCDQADPTRRRGKPAHGRLGASVVECDAPAVVAVDFRGGDLIVRAPRGRLLAGAAVRPGQIGVAGYWGRGCATL